MRTSPGPATGVGISPKAQHLGCGTGSLVPDGFHSRPLSFEIAFVPDFQSVPGNAPPSSRMFCPVMKPALAPQRNAQACAEFLGIAEASGGIELGALRQQLIHRDAALFGVQLRNRAAQPIGIERPRQQAIDGDVGDHGLARKAGDKAGEAGARAVGQSKHLDRRLHRGGSDVDDAAELARHHAVHRRLDQLDRRQHVGVERLDPVVAGPVAEIARRRAAGVVDQDIRVRAGLQRGLAAGRRGDVAGDFRHRDARTGFAYFSGGFRQRLGAARGDGDMHAFGGERHRAGASEPLAGCAYDGAAAFDPKIHCLAPVTQFS